jgi:hypothetical protein
MGALPYRGVDRRPEVDPIVRFCGDVEVDRACGKCGGLSGNIWGVEVATQKGLEPSTSAVTGRRSNQLSYCARLTTDRRRPDNLMVGTVGIEPTTPRV